MHRDLLREEGVLLGMPISMPIRIFLERGEGGGVIGISLERGNAQRNLLREVVGSHKNFLRGEGVTIGISLERKRCP